MATREDRGEAARPLRVGVLVDLALTPDAGGHVKCWQRIAEAAVDHADRLDLTVHFSAAERGVVELSPSVRYRLLPPVFSTARLVAEMPDDTDLAPWHPGLARLLAAYDVIHTTDAFFCYARTAARVGRRRGTPVVSSTHTNTPEYARISTERLLRRLFGDGIACGAANRIFPGLVKRVLERRRRRHLAGAAATMSSREAATAGADTLLRRGIDPVLFAPARRERPWFEQQFGLPPGGLVALYAGKLDAGKNVPLLAPVVAQARRMGVKLHLFCAGSGAEEYPLAAALGPAVTCAGVLPQHELARCYASADLFLFPSIIDEMGNAAIEALASGLPALLAAGSGAAARMADCPGVLVLPGDRPADWAAAIAALAAAPDRRAAMAAAARAYVETRVPTWDEVLMQDLLPVWQHAAEAAARA